MDGRAEHDCRGERLAGERVQIVSLSKVADDRPERPQADELDLLGEFQQCREGSFPLLGRQGREGR